jgi:hypothetical protein
MEAEKVQNWAVEPQKKMHFNNTGFKPGVREGIPGERQVKGWENEFFITI